MARSDFSPLCITGYGSSPSRCGPGMASRPGQKRDLPVPAQGASAHARVSDRAGSAGRWRERARPCGLPPAEQNCVGTRVDADFAAQWLAYALPDRRFARTLADADARLGAGVDRYSFTAVDLHHLLLAGLPAHSTF